MPDQHTTRLHLSRRDVLKMIAGVGATLAASRVFAATAREPLTRPIPKTNEMLPSVGLGTYRVFDIGTTAEERAPAREVLRLFVERGGSVVDSSPMYGTAEAVVGELAAELKVRDRLFLATKVWITGREEGIRQMETSLRRLRTERVDLMQVHNLVDWQTHLATLRGWKERGRVRYLGVTHYDRGAYADIERILRAQEIDLLQINYSIVSREAEARVLPLAAERRVGVIVNRPFEQAELFDKVRGKPLPAWAAELDCASWAQFFLKFVLAHPAVTCVIPATGKPGHLLDNMEAAYGRLPDAATRERMARYVREL